MASAEEGFRRLAIGDRMLLTIIVSGITILFTWAVAFPIGIYSAIRQDTAGDYLTRSFSILMLAVPSFWMGTMVMVFPSIWWGWSPEMKFVSFTVNPMQNLSQMIIPAIILGCALSAITMRLTRTMITTIMLMPMTTMATTITRTRMRRPGGTPTRPSPNSLPISTST